MLKLIYLSRVPFRPQEVECRMVHQHQCWEDWGCDFLKRKPGWKFRNSELKMQK